MFVKLSKKYLLFFSISLLFALSSFSFLASSAAVTPSTIKVVKTIIVGSFPNRPALNIINHDLYVANLNSGSVSVIDTTSNKITRTISVPNPYGEYY
ncbi:MAG: YncE family protein, partial [Nitrososphaerales archaeon]